MSESQQKNQEIKDRINFLVKEIKLNRSLRYYDRKQISEQTCDELEDELRKLDPKNPLFYGITKKEKKISKITKIIIIVAIFGITFMAFIWYFYMFYYAPFVYPYN
ncbi:MAG: hypothetical protein ACW986_15635 [Promethearchaeota archaeon]|jgi:hypothetical protein